MHLLWRDLRDTSEARLGEAGVPDPARELRWIVERAAGWSPADLVAALDEPATARQVRSVDEMVARRVAGEPLQYVLGRWGFRTLDLLIDRRVLIPRPETEVVAGLAIDVVAARPGPAVAVDLGTGSGAIALAIAAECWPHVEVWATDRSAEALAVARANLAGLGRRASVVRVARGSWYEALPDDVRGRVDVVVSNPPYVAEGDVLPEEVTAWEPLDALLAGPEGLDDLTVLVDGAPAWLAPGGSLVLEIGATQAEAVSALARDAGLVDVSVHQDLAGRDRAVVARRSEG